MVLINGVCQSGAFCKADSLLCCNYLEITKALVDSFKISKAE